MFGETPPKMASAKPSAWSCYQKKRETNWANPSVVRLFKPSLDEPTLRRIILKCRNDFVSAFNDVKSGIDLWRDTEEARTFANYQKYTSASDMALDKMEYAESLYDQYLVARSESQTDNRPVPRLLKRGGRTLID